MNESTRLLYKCIEGRYVKVTWSHKIQEIQGDIYLEKDRCVKNITCWLSVLTTGGALSSILSFIEPQISGSITAFLAILLSYFTVRYKDGQLEEKAKLNKNFAAKLHDLRNKYESLMTDILAGLLNDNEIMQVADKSLTPVWLWWLCAIVSLGGAFFFIYRIKCGKNRAISEDIKSSDTPVETFHFSESVEETVEVEKFFDRSRSAISLLGTFNVRDKDGNDITGAFTPRLKSLLVLLVLYTEKNKQGILTKKVTDILWSDKEEEAARNNRNVTLRKLRVLLEKVGDVEIISDMGFLCIRWGEGVFCDYRMALECIRQFKEKNEEHGDDKLLNQILEILLYGPLLSNTIVDWLDEFKDSYSSLSIDLLRNLLNVQRNNYDTVLRIADILFLHDPLSEEALVAKCSVLFAQGKKGIVKSVYDRFCKEYKDSLGEEYKVPLCNLYK